MEKWDADGQLCDEPTPEADRYGVGSTSCLKLRQQMAHVGLDGLLREEETFSDLAVHEPVRDELQNLDLAGRRVLAQLARRRWRERDDRAATTGTPARRSSLEAAAVIAIPIQDLLALSGVHGFRIG